jgi:hypothetical protein
VGISAGGDRGENGSAHQGGEEQAEQFHEVMGSWDCFFLKSGTAVAATSLLIDPASSDGCLFRLFRGFEDFFQVAAEK